MIIILLVAAGILVGWALLSYNTDKRKPDAGRKAAVGHPHSRTTGNDDD
jgi:hypothetical protein